MGVNREGYKLGYWLHDQFYWSARSPSFSRHTEPSQSLHLALCWLQSTGRLETCPDLQPRHLPLGGDREENQPPSTRESSVRSEIHLAYLKWHKWHFENTKWNKQGVWVMGGNKCKSSVNSSLKNQLINQIRILGGKVYGLEHIKANVLVKIQVQCWLMSHYDPWNLSILSNKSAKRP